MSRKVMVIRHLSRPELSGIADMICAELLRHGITPITDQDHPHPEVDLVIALGGDGTLLRAAGQARNLELPLIGINLGHTGFLTEAEVDEIPQVIEAIAQRSYRVEPRMTIKVAATLPTGEVIKDWALNEISVLSIDRAHPSHLGVGIDGRGVSTYGADGLILATPTGSTAYSFSAGGPVVWPDVQAMLIAPLGAHGLFTRPLVVSPESTIEVAVLNDQRDNMQIWADGIRKHLITPGSFLQATKGARPVLLAHFKNTPFSGRLVHKFDLPVKGWRSLN